MKELSQKMYFFSLVSFIKSLTYLGKAMGLVYVVSLRDYRLQVERKSEG